MKIAIHKAGEKEPEVREATPEEEASVRKGFVEKDQLDAYREERRTQIRNRLREYYGEPKASWTDLLGFQLDVLMFGTRKEKTELKKILAEVKADIPKP